MIDRYLLVLLGILAALGFVSPAVAQPAAGGSGSNLGAVGAESDGRTVGSYAGVARDGALAGEPDETPRTVAVPVCVVEPVPADFERERVLADHASVPMRARFFERVCGDVRELDWYIPGAVAPGVVPEVDALVEQVVSELTPDPPRLVTSPPSDTQALTGLPTYLAVDGAGFGVLTDEVTAGGVTVSVTLEPVRTRFTAGDGSPARECEGAGSVWSSGERPTESDCTHTYTVVPATGSGATYSLSAEVVYHGSYTVTGVLEGSFDLGEVTSPAGAVDLAVVDRRAVRVSD